MHEREPSRVLVTGGSGFIGTNLVEHLRGLGHDVVNLDMAPPRNPAHGDHWCRADLLDTAATRDAVRSVDPTDLVHLGARTDLRGSKPSDYAANTEGTRNLLAATASLPAPPRLIVASTRMVCATGYQPSADDDYCPPNAYGESKVETERIIRQSGYAGTWLLVRPTSIWGPWFGIPYRDFFLAIANGRYRHPSGVKILKSFGYVENTVHQILALLRLGETEVHGRLFYLADYEPIEVGDWARRIQEASGAAPVRTVPVGVLRAVATGGDLLKALGWREPPLTRFRLQNLLTEMLYDLEPLRRLVPTLPFSLTDGVDRTLVWLRSTDSPGRRYSK